MNTNLLICKLNTKRNGQFFKMSWCTDVPLTAQAKKDGVTVLKYTTTTVRKGINYANIKNVKDKVAKGEMSSEHKLAWGQWKAGFKGLIIEHTDKKGVYKEYVRLYATPNKPQINWFLNGRPISKEELIAKGVVPSSYWNKSNEKTECFTICTANIQDIW